jgi:hypothetical protein
VRRAKALAGVSPAAISSGASYAISAGILIVLAVLISVIIGGAGLVRLVVGADGRGSTSKAQALLWTFALAFGHPARSLQGLEHEPVAGLPPRPVASRRAAPRT